MPDPDYSHSIWWPAGDLVKGTGKRTKSPWATIGMWLVLQASQATTGMWLVPPQTDTFDVAATKLLMYPQFAIFVSTVECYAVLKDSAKGHNTCVHTR